MKAGHILASAISALLCGFLAEWVAGKFGLAWAFALAVFWVLYYVDFVADNMRRNPQKREPGLYEDTQAHRSE